MLLTSRAIAFSAAVAFAASATPSWAEPPSPPQAPAAAPASAGQATQPLAPRTPPDDVGSLTQMQREQLAKLRRQTNDKLAPERERLRAKRLELRALWLADPPSRQTILKTLGEIAAIRAAMRPILVDGKLAHLALLTREQRQSLWRPEPRHECADCQRRRGRMHPHDGHGAPALDSASWLGGWDDAGVDNEGSLELGPMECPSPDPPTPPKPMGN